MAEAVIGTLDRSALRMSEELRPYRVVLGRLLPGWSGDAVGHPDVDSPVLLGEGLLRLLRALGETGCFLRLEDLHWADEDMIALVEHLAGAVSATPVMLAVSLRDDEGVAVTRRLAAVPGVTALRLLRLGAAEVAALAAACRGDRSIPPDDAQRQLARSEGLPSPPTHGWPVALVAPGAATGRARGRRRRWLGRPGAAATRRPGGARGCRRYTACAHLPRPSAPRRAADPPRPRPSAGPTGVASARVTSREVDVLELVTAGLTNAQVAARLHLSPRTVDTHVSSLLAKTGVVGRGSRRGGARCQHRRAARRRRHPDAGRPGPHSRSDGVSHAAGGVGGQSDLAGRLPQDHIEPLLVEQVRRHGGEGRFGTELSDLHADPGGVAAELTHRLGGAVRSVQARYIVGADGPRSTVRAALGIGVEDAAMATALRSGPGFLVGDAAHRMTPVGGVGMNTALHAAHNLGWKLAWAARGWAGEALLDQLRRGTAPGRAAQRAPLAAPRRAEPCRRTGR